MKSSAARTPCWIFDCIDYSLPGTTFVFLSQEKTFLLLVLHAFETIKYTNIYQTIAILLKAFSSLGINIFHHLYGLGLFTAEIPIFTL